MNICMIGYQGRIATKIRERFKNYNFIGVDLENADSVYDNIYDAIEHNNIDYVIDFSTNSDMEVILYLLRIGIPCIIGNTTYDVSDLNKAKMCAQEYSTSLIQVRNFSLVSTIMNKILKDNFVKSKKIRLEETHHKNKKDKISGTLSEYIDLLENKPTIKVNRIGLSKPTHKAKIVYRGEFIEITTKTYNISNLFRMINFILSKGIRENVSIVVGFDDYYDFLSKNDML